MQAREAAIRMKLEEEQLLRLYYQDCVAQPSPRQLEAVPPALPPALPPAQPSTQPNVGLMAQAASPSREV